MSPRKHQGHGNASLSARSISRSRASVAALFTGVSGVVMRGIVQDVVDPCETRDGRQGGSRSLSGVEIPPPGFPGCGSGLSAASDEACITRLSAVAPACPGFQPWDLGPSGCVLAVSHSPRLSAPAYAACSGDSLVRVNAVVATSPRGSDAASIACCKDLSRGHIL